jgi:diguanylate cyclase (GGDEF)-like protein/PAS domain S-box-containing protein
MGGKSDKEHVAKTRKQRPREVAALSDRVAELEKSKGEGKFMEDAPLDRELLTAAAIEEMLDGVMLVGMDGRLAYMNRACEKLLGYKADELVGKSALELPTYTESKDKEKAREVLKKVISGGSADPIDMGLINKDGKEIPVSFTASVIKDAQGNPQTLVAVIRDITERKGMEEALRESEELSRGMLDTAATGIYLLQNGRFKYVNRLFEEISGYRSDELVGRRSLEYVHAEDREDVRTKAIEVLKGKSSLPYEFKFMRKDSETVWVLDRLTSIIYEGKRSVLGTIMDINERKRIETEVLDYTRQIETLFNIGTTVSQTLNLQELLDSVLERVLAVMEIEAGGIFLLDKQTGDLVLRAHRGTSAEFVSKVEGLRVGEGFTGRAILSKKPYVVEDVADDPRLARMGAKGEGLQSFATVPIMSKERVRGLVGVGSYSSRKFPERDVKLLGVIANQIGMAVDNAQLYEQALELAFTDGLTGLYNRRYLMEQIEREFKRVERSEGFLSLMMIDLDGLKGINDRFGHHEGDGVLRGLGDIIKANTRASDVAARWGGDEFMLLTPETGSKGARRIGERIRSQVERYRPELDGEEVGISISVGIASYPGHASDVTQLLQRVDEAMYHAKRGGRNRLCIFSC